MNRNPMIINGAPFDCYGCGNDEDCDGLDCCKVYCNGVYDMFHFGHVNALMEFSKFGRVYVGLHSDEDAKLYKRKPIMDYDERCAVVKACKYVSGVIPNTKLEITGDFIIKNDIDLVICSQFDEKYHKDPKEMGRLMVIPRTEGISTTDIISRAKQCN